MPVASVILPACNEERALPVVLAQIAALPLDLEIIVVDDGSTDGTNAVASSASVKLVSHPSTLGAGRSVKDGIDVASCDKIVMVDADASYPIERIPEILAALDEGYDLVVGARKGSEYHGRMSKRIARIIFRGIAEIATGRRIPDINSGLRAYRKSHIKPLFASLCDGFSLPTTMTLAYFFTGKRVLYIPIDYKKRIGESKVHIVRDSIRTLYYIGRSLAHFRPVKLAVIIVVIAGIPILIGQSI